MEKEITVKKGDSLWKIAKREFGDGTRWKEIASANNIKDGNKIKPGQKLVIPGKEGAEPPKPRRKPPLSQRGARANEQALLDRLKNREIATAQPVETVDPEDIGPAFTPGGGEDDGIPRPRRRPERQSPHIPRPRPDRPEPVDTSLPPMEGGPTHESLRARQAEISNRLKNQGEERRATREALKAREDIAARENKKTARSLKGRFEWADDSQMSDPRYLGQGQQPSHEHLQSREAGGVAPAVDLFPMVKGVANGVNENINRGFGYFHNPNNASKWKENMEAYDAEMEEKHGPLSPHEPLFDYMLE